METQTNGDHVINMNELSSKNQLRNGDVPNYLNTNGNNERSDLITSSTVDTVDTVDGVNSTSSNVRHLPSSLRTVAPTDVSIFLLFIFFFLNSFINRLSVHLINEAN